MDKMHFELLKEHCKIFAGGDKPNDFTSVKTIENIIPVYANGTDNEGLVGYTKIAKIKDMAITIAARGSIGTTFLRTEPYVPIVRLINIIPDKTIDCEYLYYVLKNSSIKGTGSVQSQLTVPMVKNIKIKIYDDINKQKQIARILKNIDNQIKRNNDMIQKLQDLILTTYSVKFEQNTTLNGCIKEICKLPSGFNFKKKIYIENGKYNLITIKNVNDIFINTSKVDKLNDIPKTMKSFCKLKEGDILMSLTGNVGRISIVSESNNLLNQRISLFDCKENYKTYIYALLNSQKYQILMQKMARGTSQKNLSSIDVENLQIFIPNDISEFNNFTMPIFNEMVNIKKQTNQLNKLKDTILPTLINNQLIV